MNTNTNREAELELLNEAFDRTPWNRSTTGVRNWSPFARRYRRS